MSTSLSRPRRSRSGGTGGTTGASTGDGNGTDRGSDVGSGGGLTGAEYQALAAFRHALRVFLRFSEDAARSAGLTPAQHQLLLAVKGHPGPGAPSISDVAEALQLRVHSAVELASRAAAAGLLQGRPDPTDARRHLLRLTAAGERCLADLSVMHRNELRRFRRDVVELLGPLG